MSMGYLIPSNEPVVWRGLMVMKGLHTLVRSVNWGNLDLLVIDLPPGTGDVQLTLCQMLPVNGAIIVTTPQELARNIAQKGAEMFKKVDVPIFGVVENMSHFNCPKCHEKTNFINADREEKDGYEVLARFPFNWDFSTLGDKGFPIVTSPKVENNEVKGEFKVLTEKILNKLGI